MGSEQKCLGYLWGIIEFEYLLTTHDYPKNGHGLMHICKSSSKILESYPAIARINLFKMQSCTVFLFFVSKKK